MLVIRLFRVGKKNQPSFKIVVTDKRRSTRAGRFVEEVGFYNPQTKEKVLKSERLKYWLSVGAKPSATIQNLLISEKITEGKKIPVHKKAKEKPSVAPAFADLSAEAQVAKAEATADKKAMEGEGKKEDVSFEALVKEEKPTEEKPTPALAEAQAIKGEKPAEEKPAQEKIKEETPKPKEKQKEASKTETSNKEIPKTSK